MKRFFLLLIGILYFGQYGFSQYIHYKKGDSLYVWAISGLKMRVEPNLKSDKIMTIPFGEKVAIEAFYGEEITIEVIKPHKNSEQNYEGFKMTGYWSKVKYQQKIGYVFSGYLSSLPLIEIGLRETEEGDQLLYNKEDIEQWAKRNFGLLYTNVKIDSLSGYQTKMNIYSNGIVVKHFEGDCAESFITIPSISYNETFLLLNLLWQLEQNSEFEQQFDFGITKQDKDGFKGIDEMCEFIVKNHIGVAIISITCCC